MAHHQVEYENEEVGKLAFQLTNAVVLPMVLRSALELNLIDIIATSGTSFLSPFEIAAKLPKANPNTPAVLDRMLRLLSSYDILTSSLRTTHNGAVERVYGAGAICKFLVSNKLNEEGSSIAPLFMALNDQVFLKSWDYLSESVIEGGDPFERAYGKGLIDYLGGDQRYAKAINEGMASATTLIMNKILNIYKGFEGVHVLVDVGGGLGSTLGNITSKHPHIKGINYDLPHVLAHAPSYPGVEHVAGDMFSSIPNADVVFIKWVLHDWSDENCVTILKNSRKALSENGKVIIVEAILPEEPENNVSSHIASDFDMLMLAQCTSGKERTLREYEALAYESGFKTCELKCCAYSFWVIEFNK